MTFYYLAQGVFSGDVPKDILNGNTAGGQLFRTRLDDLWSQYIGSADPIWLSLVQIGAWIAAGCLAWNMVVIFKKLTENETIGEDFDRFLWILFIVSLLVSNGRGVGVAVKGLRGFILGLDTNISSQLTANTALKNEYQDAFGKAKAKRILGEAYDECSGVFKDQDLWTSCMEDRLSEAQSNATDPGLANAIGDLISSIATKTLNVAEYVGSTLVFAEDRIKLYLAGIAFTLAADMGMFIAGLSSPVAISTSLMPGGHRSVFGLLSMFYAIGMAKISYTLMVGFFASVLSDTQGIGDYLIAIMIGKVVPLLAMTLGGGGGIVLYSTASSFAMGKIGNINLWGSIKSLAK